jgi:adenylate cyclase
MGPKSQAVTAAGPDWNARLRQWHGASGLFMVVFLTTHFLAHACGLAGLAGIGAGGHAFGLIWGNPVAMPALGAAFLIHYSSALTLLYRRRRLFKLPRWDQSQIVLGLLVPPLLAPHVWGAIMAGGGYSRVLYAYTVADPAGGLRQLTLSIVVWSHAAIGLWNRYRLRSWYPAWRPWAIGVVVGLPAAGLAGVLTAGREVAVRAEQADWLATVIQARAPDAETIELVQFANATTVAVHVAILVLIFAARAFRDYRERRRGRVRVTYPDRRTAVTAPATTVLEASRAVGYPHASVCGGRGRCSTCRFRVIRGAEYLSPAQPAELRVLHQVGGHAGVRLGCQARIFGDVDVVPLVSTAAGARAASGRDPARDGEERNLAVLFADLRGFTAFAEHKLPYDTVFVLNRFADLMQRAIEGAGGHVDKFLGDGVMAIFGMNGEDRPCRGALVAAVAMQRAVARMNAQLGDTLGTEFRLGIGIHYGPAVLGAIGVGPAASVTVIGDVVNTASRLEQATKTLAAPVVASSAVVAQAGLGEQLGRRQVEAVPGRTGSLEVVAFADIDELERLLAEPAMVPGTADLATA